MTLELINGELAAAEGGSGFFTGTVSPRRYHIHESLMARAEGFLAEAFAGRRSGKELREAFSTSDFTLAAYASIDSEMLTAYNELPSVWRSYTTVTTVQDFRPKRLMDRWSKNLGLKLVPEFTEYPTGEGHGHATAWINVAKYGLRDAISWEAFINNEAIGELEEAPGRFARAANETEVINALANILNIDPATNTASDLNTGFFKNHNSGIYSGVNNSPDDKPLTAENLDAALSALSLRKSPKSGRQIAQPDVTLVVPKAQEWNMQKIRALREIRTTTGGTTSVYDNYLTVADYVVEPMLDAVLTHADAAKFWFILPKPSTARPASFAAFLRGYETPDLRVKADTGTRIGGGAIAPREGSFEVDDIQHRIRHVVGRQTGDPTFTYASRGNA